MYNNYLLWCYYLVSHYLFTYSTGWPKKVSHYQMIKKFYLIILKPVIDIKFMRRIKEWIKHYPIRWH